MIEFKITPKTQLMFFQGCMINKWQPMALFNQVEPVKWGKVQ